MCSLASCQVDLKGLAERITTLEFDLDDAYFEALDAPEVRSGTLHVSVSIRKASGFFELLFHTEGTVRIPCDRCIDDMEQPITADNRLMVCFGIGESEDDDVVLVDEEDPILDLSWHLYEFIVLAIPVRHVHAPGKCNAAMIAALEEHSTDRSSDVESTQPLDPRWNALRNLMMTDEQS